MPKANVGAMITNLGDRVEALNKLMSSPEPGLFTWHMACNSVYMQIKGIVRDIDKELGI